jgi:hypothetical protein
MCNNVLVQVRSTYSSCTGAAVINKQVTYTWRKAQTQLTCMCSSMSRKVKQHVHGMVARWGVHVHVHVHGNRYHG